MGKYDEIIIAADLDGTLFDNQNDIPKVNLDAIESFTKEGGKFVIASGRGIEAVRSVFDMLPTSSPAIVNNGHTLFDFNENRIISSHSLPMSAKVRVSELFESTPTLAIEVYSEMSIYIVNQNRVIKKHLDYVGIDYNIVELSDIYDLEWNKVLLTDEKEVIDNVRKQAYSRQYDGFEFVDTSDLFLEMVKTGISKGTALLELADYYGIPRKNTYSIGNYYNDIGLLDCAFESAVVKGTPEAVAAHSSYVCEKSASEGAVAEYMAHILNKAVI